MQGGGIETTALTAVTQFAHHGMPFIPTGYSFGERLFAMDEVRGGTAYGASTYAGPTGSRQPSELELDYAQHQVWLLPLTMLACMEYGRLRGFEVRKITKEMNLRMGQTV